MAEKNVTIRIAAQDSFSSVLAKYQHGIGQAEQATKRLNNTASSTGGVLSGLGRDLTGFVTAIGIQQIVTVIGGITEMGYQARATDATFLALTGSTEEYNDMLTALRSSTGNVVSDMELMASTSRFLQMGLATTTDEAARLAEMAVKLGGAMGRDAGTALEEFALLMANQSILRLDTFGISAARVRARIDELKNAGIQAEEAFRLAVLEQGSAALTRLGDAADVSSTSFARLQTRWENFAASTASRVATGIEGIALAIENLDKVVVAADDAGVWDALWSLTPGGTITGAATSELARQQLAAGAPVGRGGRGGFGQPDISDVMSLPSEAFVQAQYAAAMQGRAADFMRSFSLNANSVVGIAGSHNRSGFFSEEDTANLDNYIRLAESAVEELEAMNALELIGDDELERAQQMLAVMKDNADQIERGAEAFNRMSLNEMLGQSGGGRLGEVFDTVLSELEAGGMSDDQIAEMTAAFDLASGRITEVSEFFRNELGPSLAQIASDRGAEAAVDAATSALENLEQARMAGLSERSQIMAMQVGSGYIGGGGGQQFTVQPGDSVWGLSQSSGMSMDDIRRELGIGSSNLIQPGMSFGGGGEGMSLDLLNDLAGAVGPTQDIATATTTFSEQIGAAVDPVAELNDLLPDTQNMFGQVANYATTARDSMAALVAQTNVVRVEIRATAPQWIQAMFGGAAAGAAFVADVIANQGGVGNLPGGSGR